MERALTTLYIVRHGESDGNVRHILQGQINSSKLTENGKKQARTLGKKLSQIPFAAVFSSDLTRAKQTAQLIALERKLAVTTTKALRERNYGEFEGRPYRHYEEELKDLLAQYQTLTKEAVFTQDLGHGIELPQNMIARVFTFLREVAVGYRGKNILMVTHGSLMRYLLIHLGYATHHELPIGAVGNTAYIKLASDGVDFFIQEVAGVKKMIG